jgi:hypothetical protein
LIEELGHRYATRIASAVVEPALKRGATFDCRYRGKGAAARRIFVGAAAAMMKPLTITSSSDSHDPCA